MTIPGHGGAPMKYDPETFKTKIDEYFIFIKDENEKRKVCKDKIKPPTMSGICVFLGISRDTWSEYAKKPEFSETIKKTRTIVENFVEEGLLNGSVNTIGAIFNLKNNFGWVDKIDISTNDTAEQMTPEEIMKRLKKNNFRANPDSLKKNIQSGEQPQIN